MDNSYRRVACSRLFDGDSIKLRFDWQYRWIRVILHLVERRIWCITVRLSILVHLKIKGLVQFEVQILDSNLESISSLFTNSVDYIILVYSQPKKAADFLFGHFSPLPFYRIDLIAKILAMKLQVNWIAKILAMKVQFN